jgi:hypothetical protein
MVSVENNISTKGFAGILFFIKYCKAIEEESVLSERGLPTTQVGDIFLISVTPTQNLPCKKCCAGQAFF